MAKCSCGGDCKVTMLLPCSGAADLGEIADRVSRKLRDQGIGEMSCLAGIGAGVSGFIESAKSADSVIAIDGCSVACTKKSLEKIGITPKSFILTEFGLVKFKTPATEEAINTIVEKIKQEVKQ